MKTAAFNFLAVNKAFWEGDGFRLKGANFNKVVPCLAVWQSVLSFVFILAQTDCAETSWPWRIRGSSSMARSCLDLEVAVF